MPMFKKKQPEVPPELPELEEETPVMALKSGKIEKEEEKEGKRTVQDYLTTKMAWELDVLSVLIDIRENLNTNNALIQELLTEVKK